MSGLLQPFGLRYLAIRHHSYKCLANAIDVTQGPSSLVRKGTGKREIQRQYPTLPTHLKNKNKTPPNDLTRRRFLASLICLLKIDRSMSHHCSTVIINVHVVWHCSLLELPVLKKKSRFDQCLHRVIGQRNYQ